MQQDRLQHLIDTLSVEPIAAAFYALIGFAAGVLIMMVWTWQNAPTRARRAANRQVNRRRY